MFPGHHEYVTTREYDVIERYRDLGGNLMFLSANNFFWRVVRHGQLVAKNYLLAQARPTRGVPHRRAIPRPPPISASLPPCAPPPPPPLLT